MFVASVHTIFRLSAIVGFIFSLYFLLKNRNRWSGIAALAFVLALVLYALPENWIMVEVARMKSLTFGQKVWLSEWLFRPSKKSLIIHGVFSLFPWAGVIRGTTTRTVKHKVVRR